MSDPELNDLDHDVPDGWVREEKIVGMNVVGRDGYQDIGGGYKCETCDHYIPIESIDDSCCPMCGTCGMLGTVIMGSQEHHILSPKGWFDE